MKVLVFCFALCMSLLSWSFSAYAYTDYGDTVEVTVVTKDNLINICKTLLEEPRKWGIIAKINKLRNPDFIFPGQKLIIPADMLRGVPLDGMVTFVSGEVRAQAKEGEEWKTSVFLNVQKFNFIDSKGKDNDTSSADTGQDDMTPYAQAYGTPDSTPGMDYEEDIPF